MGTAVVTDQEIEEGIATLVVLDGDDGNVRPLIDLLQKLKDERAHYGPAWRARAEGAEESESDLRQMLRDVHGMLDEVSKRIANHLHLMEELEDLL